MKFYTGVGSRKTPPDVLDLMTWIADWLESRGWILRSGGAKGADRAFEVGAGPRAQIYRPEHATAEAMAMAAAHHPAWHRLGDWARRLHARNCFQVLGRDLKTPSRFVVCWTPDGCVDDGERSVRTGGTGTAISIASHHGIPVFNLKRADHRRRIERRIC